VTAPGVEEIQVVPFEVSKFPTAPAATAETVEPVPTKAPVAVVSPVPPLLTASVADKPAAFVALVARVASVARVAKVAVVAFVAEDALPDNAPLKVVVVSVPVLGTNVSLVLATFCGVLPVVADTQVG
jgi:hypothetical protein